MPTTDRDVAIVALAATNGGYVTVSAALSAGFTRSEIRTRVRNGEWEHAAPGLLRLPDHESADLWIDRVMKAVTATRMGAVAARYTAARLQTIAGAPVHAPIEVAVPPDCHPAGRPGVRPVRTLVGQTELVEVHGIVTTGPLRTVVDCARYGDHVAAVCLLESAAMFRRFTDRHADMPGYVVQTVRRALERLDRLDRLTN